MARELGPVADLAGRLLSGGKRLRPAFCAAGYLAAAGQPKPEELPGLLDAAASLELLHVSALVHDDVMDASDLRRGQPAAHRQFETLHTTSGWLGDPEAYGRAAAILLGDLLLMWSVEMLRSADLPADTLAAAAPIAETMRTEVTAGQYLDVVAQVRPLNESALASSTEVLAAGRPGGGVQVRPLHGAAAGPTGGGAGRRLGGAAARPWPRTGCRCGRAFQFRDDLLGVFGDPAVTGKPAGDDLREGKRTVLIAHAYAQTAAAGRAGILRSRLGDPALDAAGVRELRQVIIDSGAREAVEQMIKEASGRGDRPPWTSAAVTAEGRSRRWPTWPRRPCTGARESGPARRLVEPLVQDVVLPAAGDLEVARGEPDLGEAVLGQHAARRIVVDQGAGLEPVQIPIAEGQLDHRGDGGGRDAAALVVAPDPVAERPGAEPFVDDVDDVDRPARTPSTSTTHGSSVRCSWAASWSAISRPLTGLGEVPVGADGIPASEEVPIGRSMSASAAASSSLHDPDRDAHGRGSAQRSRAGSADAAKV